jgi:HSP20 family molecular chaperone IbpA
MASRGLEERLPRLHPLLSISTQVSQSFSPRFDVREMNDSYLLDGEVSGISQSDIEIEFADSNTLVIKGRSQRDYKNSVPEMANSSNQVTSPKSHQPTVEDEVNEGESSVTTSAKLSPKEASLPAVKYWVAERHVGQFQRMFTFQTKVDQDGVKANLKNGILSIVIPKAPVSTPKKIRIE